MLLSQFTVKKGVTKSSNFTASQAIQRAVICASQHADRLSGDIASAILVSYPLLKRTRNESYDLKYTKISVYECQHKDERQAFTKIVASKAGFEKRAFTDNVRVYETCKRLQI